MTSSPDAIPRDVMVGSVVETTHDIDLNGSAVTTRARAVRAPRWAVTTGVFILLWDGYCGGFVRSVLEQLLGVP